MADKRDVFDNEPLSRNNEPRLSHALDKGPAPNSIGEAPIGKRRAKSKQVPWFKNPEVVKVVVAGAVVLVVVLIVLVWQFGLLDSSSQSKPPVAAAPPTPQPSPTIEPQQQNPQLPSPETQPALPEQKPVQEPPVEEPPQEQKPPLPADVADWKADDYFRARRENDPKLLEAVAYLGKTFPGKKPAAEGLTKLLKPLPPEKPAEQPTPGQNPPGAAGVAPFGPPGIAPPGAREFGPPGAPGIMQPPPDGLLPPNINRPNPGMSPYNPGNLAGLVEAIVTALGNNGSEVAQNTIEQVLSGTFKTDDDKAAVEAALKALLAHPGQENDALMLRVLTEPDDLRPHDRQGPWPAKELQAKALELTKQSASSGLRLELAKALVEHRVKLDPKDPMHEFLLASDPLNCGAQLTFYEEGHQTPELETRLEDQFLVYSSLAMARYLDIPDKFKQSTSGVGVSGMHTGRPGGLIGGFDMPGDRLTGPGRTPSPPAGLSTKPGGKVGAGEDKPKTEDDLAPRVAAGLWSQGFLALLEPKLTTHALDSLDKKPKLVMLAGTIPQDSTRALLNKLLRKRWSEGPKALETAGLTGNVVTDPGLLTLVKMLKRRYPKTSARGTPRAPRPTGGTINKRIEEARKEQQTAEEWMDLSSKMVAVWCNRFHAATQARQKAAEDSEIDSSAPLKLPKGFELSSNARVTASFHLVWPDEAPPEIAKLNPGWLEVHYVRVEEVKKLRTATAYYSRQADLRSSDARTIGKSTWFDKVRIGSRKDRRRSLDVLITPPENYVPADKPRDEDETDLIIEILSVEIKDPTK
ncbi:MAG: hypothetical protein K8R46_04935 [Pirellulales bacterium]|nr:hypothetical protein [Pirellulales bacterium]